MAALHDLTGLSHWGAEGREMKGNSYFTMLIWIKHSRQSYLKLLEWIEPARTNRFVALSLKRQSETCEAYSRANHYMEIFP